MIGLGLGITSVAARARRTVTTPDPLAVFDAAVAGVQAGTRRATILCIGDSLGIGGTGTGGASDGLGCYGQTAWPIRMGVALAGAGVPCNSNGWMGDGGSNQFADTYYGAFNTQVAVSGAWDGVAYAPDTYSRSGLGGSSIIHVKTAASGSGDGFSIAFTPTGVQPSSVTNKLRLFVHRTNVAALSVVEGGGTPATLPITPGDDTFVRLEYTAATRAAHSYTINTNPTAQDAYVVIQGGYAYDSQTPAVDIINASLRGAGVEHWISAVSAHSYLTSIPTIAPDLTIIMPPVNDLVRGTSVATFTTQLQTLITACKVHGDVMLVNAPGVRIGGPNSLPSQATRDTYTAAMASLASTNNLTFVDLEAQLGTWAANSSEYFDDLHPRGARSNNMGVAIAGALATLPNFSPSLNFSDSRNSMYL